MDTIHLNEYEKARNQSIKELSEIVDGLPNTLSKFFRTKRISLTPQTYFVDYLSQYWNLKYNSSLGVIGDRKSVV